MKNKKAGKTIDNVVTEELEVPSGINKSGRKVFADVAMWVGSDRLGFLLRPLI